MSEEWGPWIEHDGRGCPCHGKRVQAEFDVGTPRVIEGVVHCVKNNGQWDWELADRYGLSRIIRYRIRKPRGMTILENLIADLPAPSLEPSPINETAPREGLPA